MEINKFNELMKKFSLLSDMPKDMSKEIGLLTIIENLLDTVEKKGKIKYRKEGCFIIPPWLYDVKDSSLVLHLGKENMEVCIREELVELVKERQPFIRILEKNGSFILEIPKMI